MRKSLKDLIIFITVGGLTRLVPILFFPIVLNFFTREEFGLFTLFNLYIGLGSIVLSLGIEQALFRFLPSAKKSEKEKYINTAILTIILIILLFTLYIPFKTQLDSLLFDHSIGLYSLWLFPLILLVNLSAVLIVILKSEQKTQTYLSYNLIRIIIYSTVFIAALYSGLKLEAFFLAFALSEFTVIAISFNRIKCIFTKKPDFSFIKKVLQYSLPVMGINILAIILYQADHYMIKYFINIKTVGVYHFGYKFSAILGTLVLLANSAWLPRLFEQKESFSERMFSDYSLTLNYLNGSVFILIFLIFSYFSGFFLTEDYKESIEVFKILGFGYLFFSNFQILDTILLFKKKTNILLIISLITLFINIGLNYYFIPRYGIISAAIITTASFILEWGFIVVYLNYVEKTYYINSSIYKFLGYILFLILVIFFLNPAFSIILLAASVVLIFKRKFIKSIFIKENI